MIAGLKPYPKYQDTDLPWLDSMPSNWSKRRMKFLFRERVQKGFPHEPLLAATQRKGVVRKSDYESRTVTASKDFHLLKLVETGDFVISLRSFEGGIELAHARGIISPAYTILCPGPDAVRAFYSRFFKSADFIRSLTLFVTGIREGQNIDYERLSRAYMPLPPAEDQIAIGRFLDWSSGRLDKAIRSKQRVVMLLNEQRQTIINHAVTRGIDASARLKPSGIPWVGDIPEHWDIRRAKYIFHEVDERSLDGGEELLSVSHITGVTPRSQKNITMFKAASYSGHKLCQPGDLVVNTMWAWMGALGVSTYSGIISPAYAVYRPHQNQRFVREYIDGLLRSRPYISNILCRSTGVRSSRLRMYPEEFFRLPIILPPFSEQQRIVESIGVKSAGVNKSIARLEREIELLQELKTSLVNDVVTGKVDVRGAGAQLPKDVIAEAANFDADQEIDDETLEEEVSL
ncbi:restriction endonuclease subunit S [Acidicapsa acidisoli]|uniref:restriction endonuclease subunit S n=1 Tax=Acidicapsa acidisoli TaxID=1615681 RepID=UPI0021DF5A5F|nr:restriction endonuclease subunit S [Acidicapsa acidisoli]